MFLEQHIRMISVGSCDTGVMMLKIQLWSQQSSLTDTQTVILNCNNISQFYCILPQTFQQFWIRRDALFKMFYTDNEPTHNSLALLQWVLHANTLFHVLLQRSTHLEQNDFITPSNIAIAFSKKSEFPLQPFCSYERASQFICKRVELCCRITSITSNSISLQFPVPSPRTIAKQIARLLRHHQHRPSVTAPARGRGICLITLIFVLVLGMVFGAICREWKLEGK